MDSPIALLRRHGIQAKKSWGQCFLKEPSILERIADAAELSPTDTVVEIGAGLGTLTSRLAARAARVIAIERDRDLVPILRAELASLPSVEIVEANALDFSFAGLGAESLQVVGNLPYNISSPILFHLIAERAHLGAATLMLQREVAARLCAAPGTSDYGIPSVLLRQVAETRICFHVPATAFTPQPRVESAVVRIVFLREPREVVEEARLAATVRAAFRFRRKTLRRALELAFPGAALAALAEAGIDGTRRGETLDLAELARLARALEQVGAT
jgi:16S rRNA (adenine1518-N6/adenine1519-N6)-dimethyltransferase